MKRVVSGILLALMIVLTVTVSSMAQDVLTIDEALEKADTFLVDIIPVSNDLSAFDPDNYVEDLDYGNLKMIVLERIAPLKAFTAVDSGYPLNYQPGLPNDFVGQDIGEPTLILRYDLMKQLPGFLRASSLQDADLLLVAENKYYLSGSISITDYQNGGKEDKKLPVFDTSEELKEYLAEHQPIVSKITYYPKFTSGEFLSLYNIRDKNCSWFAYETLEGPRFAQNPQAADQWENMEDLLQVINQLSEGNAEKVTNAIDQLVFIPEYKKTLWIDCINAGENGMAHYGAMEYYWHMAGELADMDMEEDHHNSFQLIISQQDIEGLRSLVNYFNYSGFDTPVEMIEKDLSYITQPDYSWFDERFSEFIVAINE